MDSKVQSNKRAYCPIKQTGRDSVMLSKTQQFPIGLWISAKIFYAFNSKDMKRFLFADQKIVEAFSFRDHRWKVTAKCRHQLMGFRIRYATKDCPLQCLIDYR